DRTNVEYVSKPGPVSVLRGEQCVRVDVPEVHVNAPTGPDDVTPVATQIVHAADPGLKVVPVRLRVETEILQADDAFQQAGAGGALDFHEIRVLRLVERNAGDEVVTESKVQREPVAGSPIVLNIQTILLVRSVRIRVAAVDQDLGKRAV